MGHSIDFVSNIANIRPYNGQLLDAAGEVRDHLTGATLRSNTIFAVGVHTEELVFELELCQRGVV